MTPVPRPAPARSAPEPPEWAFSPASTFVVGGVIAARYRVVGRIGAGGMATLFRARDETLERDVAVKVLHAHLADDSSLRERFRTEARHAAGLLHPNIVNTFDQGVAELPFIVMEFVDGPSLRDALTRRGRLSPGEALSVVEPICAGLARAHAAGLVHRDVKPENVLLAPDGTPKVADFGIARAIAATSHTTAGTLIGSVHYMAPELVDGQEATPRSDQYAVGVLLFELLTGRKPLDGDSPMAVALRHAREAIPAPSRFAADVPKALDRVVARATAAEPRKRFDDVAALAAALRAAVPTGPRALVVPPASGDTTTDTVVVRPVEEADTVTVRVRRGRGRLRRAPGPRRRRRWPWVLAALCLLAGGGLAAWHFVIAPLTPVPAVTDLPAARARAELDAAGLAVGAARREFSLAAPAGAVVSQEPAAGDVVRRGEPVDLVVSRGPATVTMPKVVRSGEGSALSLLEGDRLALDVDVDRAWSDTVPKGIVMGQRPGAGTRLEQGSPAALVVSRGIEQVTVPDLAGQTRAQARRLLRNAKLQPVFKGMYSDELPRQGAVIRQLRRAGVTVDKGTRVKVVVSRGPLTYELPDLVGQGLSAAAAALERQDLRVAVIEQPRPRIGPFRVGDFGLVEYQDPSPGTGVRRGSQVTLYTFSEAAED